MHRPGLCHCLSRLRHQQHNLLEAQAKHTQFFCGSAAHVYHAATAERPPVSDAHIYFATIHKAVHAHQSAKRQSAVGCGEGMHVIFLATGRAPTVKTWTIPGGTAPFKLARDLASQQGWP